MEAKGVGRGGGRTKGGYDDGFGALGDEFAEGFGEGEIPADEEADGAERGLDDGVGVVEAGFEMGAFGVPFAVAEDDLISSRVSACSMACIMMISALRLFSQLAWKEKFFGQVDVFALVCWTP